MLEAGQVWKCNDLVPIFAGTIFVLSRVSDCAYGFGFTNGKGSERPIGQEGWIRIHASMIAPAPKPGQRWSKSTFREDDIFISDHQNALLAHTSWGYWACNDNAVTIASWLLEHGYKHVPSDSAMDLIHGDTVRCDRYRVTGKVIRPSMYDGGNFDVLWTADGKTGSDRMSYCDVDTPSLLAEGFWRIVKPEPAKPRIELRDGMRVVWSNTIIGTLSPVAGMWHVNWGSSHDIKIYATNVVLLFIAEGIWTIIDDAPPATVDAALSDPLAQTVVNDIIPGITSLFHCRGCGALITHDGVCRKICRSVHIQTKWTRVDSRKAIDAAIARIRNEPFAHAIQAVLVAVADREDPTQLQIDAVIAGCKAWERRRGEVAPGRRLLTEEQRAACAMAGNEAGGCRGAAPGAPRMGDVYERARAVDRPIRRR